MLQTRSHQHSVSENNGFRNIVNVHVQLEEALSKYVCQMERQLLQTQEHMTL